MQSKTLKHILGVTLSLYLILVVAYNINLLDFEINSDVLYYKRITRLNAAYL